MESIIISENHRRSIGASLRIVEEHLNEMEKELTNPEDGILLKMQIDIQNSSISKSLQNIAKAKKHIKNLAEKYRLSVQSSQLSRVIDSRKTSIWVTLSDSTSEKLKIYGVFPPEYSAEFDNDINELQELVNQI